jgi:EAL domain-containing protein (putative c-di-GMP-specific phosphodiesterase class I)
LQLLLVASSPRWTSAVNDAVADIVGGSVQACDARAAVSRLATENAFSHLLLEKGCEDGLLEILAALTAQPAKPTSLLMLGGMPGSLPHHGLIPSADPASVRNALSALTARTPPTSSAGVGYDVSPHEMNDALHGTMIETRYQPIVRMSDRHLVGLETLARLNHPARGTLLPDHFVPQMEGAGRASELTRIVAGRMFADLAVAPLASLDATVSLNMPLDVLTEAAARHWLEQQRLAAGIPSAKLVIELTESQPVEDFRALEAVITELRAQGYGVSIDDVGPGTRALESLLRLPFSCVKLDKGLVQRSASDPQAIGLVQHIVGSAHATGMSVIAEGVSTVELWDLMRQSDVDEAQGFLIARPLPAPALPVWLDAWTNRSSGDRPS